MNSSLNSRESAEQYFLDHLETIEKAIRFATRRRAFRGQEAEDFRSYVSEKLIEDNYRVFRRFEGRSSLQTYLCTVILRLGLDFQIAKWGKWRPSACARRMGTEAVHLERLLHRDGCDFGEAARIIQSNLGLDISLGRLEEIAARLPVRTHRTFEGEDVLVAVAAGGPTPDQALLETERADVGRRVFDCLEEARADLEVTDRLILRMSYESGLTVAQIAKTLSLEQKPLYRRLEKIRQRLRLGLERRGVTKKVIDDLLGS